ncbi:MAG: AAA family ATPase [Rhodoferax sp.]|nr:AAA family ATPase [Rhodoferax sp.]
MEDIDIQSKRVATVMEKIKEAMLAPQARKQPPTFGSSELAALCNIDKQKIAYQQLKGDLPSGVLKGNRREWTLQEVQAWVAEYRREFLRPKLFTSGVTITVANFKGGVAKTTSAVSLAQGLSLKGHKVLMIDLDPQGSATTLFGFIPDADVEREQTALALFEGDEEMIDSAIRPTYWPGIDLVSAAPMLFSAEFALPARQMKDPGFEFWKVLEIGLDQARRDYDVIIIDTPPALSYVTINALLAAEGVVMPLPPNALDFASSSQFWDLFSDLCNQLYKGRGQQKTFEFVDVLLSRVEANDSASSVVRQWIIEAYGDKVLPIEIPKTSVTVAASAEFGTIYDVPKGTMAAKTYSRAKDAYDRYCTLLEEQIRAVWTKQVDYMEQYAKISEKKK